MNDPAMAKNLTRGDREFREPVEQAQSGAGHDGQADERTTPLYQRLNAVTTNLEQLTAKLNQGQGTMGQLMNDKQLYDNMNRTVTEMQSCWPTSRKDPKKFLNVRMSIF